MSFINISPIRKMPGKILRNNVKLLCTKDLSKLQLYRGRILIIIQRWDRLYYNEFVRFTEHNINVLYLHCINKVIQNENGHNRTAVKTYQQKRTI